MLVDLQCTNLRFQRRGRKAKLGGGTCESAGSAAPVATNSPIDGLWGQLEADASGSGIQRDEKHDNE